MKSLSCLLIFFILVMGLQFLCFVIFFILSCNQCMLIHLFSYWQIISTMWTNIKGFHIVIIYNSISNSCPVLHAIIFKALPTEIFLEPSIWKISGGDSHLFHMFLYLILIASWNWLISFVFISFFIFIVSVFLWIFVFIWIYWLVITRGSLSFIRYSLRNCWFWLWSRMTTWRQCSQIVYFNYTFVRICNSCLIVLHFRFIMLLFNRLSIPLILSQIFCKIWIVLYLLNIIYLTTLQLHQRPILEHFLKLVHKYIRMAGLSQ